MSSDAQAGTPAPSSSDRVAGTDGAKAGDGSGNDAQKWEEALKWKQKAEDYNKITKELEETRQALMQTQQMFSTANRATDPMTELRSTLQAQAEYDPASKAALVAMRQNEHLAAELWLSNELLKVPDAKKSRVADLIRNSGYQMGAEGALSMVTDPETKTLAEKLAEAEKTIERLKNAKPNGSSPASAVPATSSASEDGGSPKELKRSEYIARLKAGGDDARALMKAVGSNQTKLVDD